MKFDTTQGSYISLRNKITERTDDIIAWVGAGMSAEAKLPNWSGMRENLTRTLAKKASTFEDKVKDKIVQTCQEIKKLNDNWLAFQRLKKELEETTYRDTIREMLRTAPSVTIPSSYKYLWDLRIRGLINLNLDRLATRAYHEKLSSAVIEFNGKTICNHLNILKSPQRFICNIHGTQEEYSSWVFTRNELNGLKSLPGYKEFIQTWALTSTFLFIGITVDDEAVGGHLENIRNITDDLGAHFWLTDRRDLHTDHWAEKLGIRIIRYESKNGDHSAVNEFFSDLLSYIPQEEIAPPVAPLKIPNKINIIENPKELAKLESEQIRRVLNQKAQSILSESTEEAYKIYEKFFSDYDEAIYRAWYTSEKDGQNDLLGYKLEKFHAKGAFGKVYRARDEKGNIVAIKILLEEERKKPDFLQSFRRGVRSMKLLSNRNVNGVVGYKEAYEIPAFVVMDWIDGPNLDLAIKTKEIQGWQNILKIGRSLSKIIENAHRIPERVLHRDIRPPNIMLQGFYSDRLKWKVVVLDFDLSWHLGASEKSIVGSGSTTGYLAPEQIQQSASVSTRHAAVDSYGIGMTLFFMIAGRDPFPTENLHREWQKSVYESANRIRESSWKSLPNRFSRLIINATRLEQYARWDISQIRTELERLSEALKKPDNIESAELIAEEIFCRTKYSHDYEWDSDKLCAMYSSLSGVRISLVGHESKKQLILKIEWSDQGGSERKTINKWLEKNQPKILNQLTASSWKIESQSTSGRALHITASLDVLLAKKQIDEIVRCIDKITIDI
ncbi:MAG: protein kinase [Bacteroidota bacterium]